MEKYIGIKEVEAKPMSLGEFIKYKGRNPYEKDPVMHNELEEGYLVKYKDGYESWSPKEVFDEAYMIANSTIDRVEFITTFIANESLLMRDYISSEKFKRDFPNAVEQIIVYNLAKGLGLISERIGCSLAELDAIHEEKG